MNAETIPLILANHPVEPQTCFPIPDNISDFNKGSSINAGANIEFENAICKLHLQFIQIFTRTFRSF